MNLSAFRTASIAAITILAAVLIAWQFGLFSPEGSPGRMGIAKVGGPFKLTDHNGIERDSREFRGRLMLIYFGYTFCPDVCPTALQIMNLALQSLKSTAREIQPIFISIDPTRDTPKILKKYVQNFYPGLIGFTGSKKSIKDVAKKYRIYYAKASTKKPKVETKDYLMDHSSTLFLLDRKGRYISHFNHQSQPEAITKVLQKYL